MACDVFDAFRAATESLPDHIYRNASYNSYWLNLIPRDSFKSGTGLVQTTFNVANVEPVVDDETWAAVTLATGTGQGACASTYNALNVGFDENTYRPEGLALQGPVLCKDDLVYDNQVDKFLRAYIEELTKRAQRTWEGRYESVYYQYARKISATTSMSFNDTTGCPYSNGSLLPGKSAQAMTKPTSVLTQDHLDAYAIELIDAGSTNPDSNGFIQMGPDGPIFGLYVGLDASKRILQNSGSAEFRNDVRYADPSNLMKRLGAGRVLKNYRHMPNLKPPRYIYGGTLTVTTTNGSPTLTAVTNNGINIGDLFLAGGSGFTHTGAGRIPITGTGIPASTYIGSYNGAASASATLGLVDANGTAVNATATGAGIVATVATTGQFFRVPRFYQTAATKGFKTPPNNQWKYAAFESAAVLSPRVFTSEIIKPMNAAGGASWNPTNYMGEWMFVTGGTKISSTCSNGADPLEKMGAHFAEFKHAPRPEYPMHGQVIFFRRSTSAMADAT